jgi:PAS domain S-box-containing protein
MDARFNAVLSEHSPDALIVLTQEGRVLHRSAGAESIFGYTRDEAAIDGFLPQELRVAGAGPGR